ncbi:energy transducer TonB [Accumulibacter sp.]|uniref:energy transducer TonB n=1 Tax=Accumulibacter sp. TaxID=2053492 RepID=UPI0025EAC024|nr:energy transducer TonB [Accumulibacter sp.]MCM8613254.1 energy transducer TonB [Accumulibacter sp.]MCM8636918.1 energy transducer TonB [Accumulibacter sp.]MCM8638906.1 energy transducer TonB [Accumulibacter sp.]
MSFQLLPALALSLLLHAAVLWWNVVAFDFRPAPTPRLQASLQPPIRPEPASYDPLLKNTLSSGDPSPATATPPPQPTATPTSRAVARRQVEAAQRKISQHLYYPPEAVARGIEGEVRLLLRLGDDGSIVDVQVAAGSGHAILDQAAVKAAYAMGRANWAQSRELILPVIFRLQ